MNMLNIIAGLAGAHLGIWLLWDCVHRGAKCSPARKLFLIVCGLMYVICGVVFFAEGLGFGWATSTLAGGLLSWFIVPFLALGLYLALTKRKRTSS